MRKIGYPRPPVESEDFDPVDIPVGYLGQEKLSFARML
jgi:hypothetical protein